MSQEATALNPNQPTPIQPIVYRPAIGTYKLKFLVYGDPGVGKTTLAATANLCKATAPALVINIEGGLLSVIDYKLDTVDLDSYPKLVDLFWFLAKGKHEYKTVIIDSLSELQLLNLDYVVGQAINKPSSSGAKRDDLDDVWRDDYGKSTQQIRRAIRSFRDLDMHVIFTCLAASKMDDLHQEQIFPQMTPKLRSSVMGYMDIIGYLYTQEIEGPEKKPTIARRMLCQPYGKFLAKDRSPGGKLGLVLDEPTIGRMMDLIIEKKIEKGETKDAKG